MSGPLAHELHVANEALNKALTIARARYRTELKTSVKDVTGDIVTDVDLLCEAKIMEIIRAAFPDHAIDLEEAPGYRADSPWKWVVDPLDGTNNYAYGLPLWTISVALCHYNEPVLACIAEGSTGTITAAIRGVGVSIDGMPWTPRLRPPRHSSAALWIGYETDRTAKDTRALLAVLSATNRRIFENWAPTIDVGLFLRGGIELVVGKDCSGTELPAALLILREAGATILDIEGSDVALERIPSLFVAGRAAVARSFVDNLQAALVRVF